MGWHYQVVRTVDRGEESFAIHEAYPDIREDGEPLPITENAITPYGETIEDLRWSLRAMLEDIDRHGVVEMSDYPASDQPQHPDDDHHRDGDPAPRHR